MLHTYLSVAGMTEYFAVPQVRFLPTQLNHAIWCNNHKLNQEYRLINNNQQKHALHTPI